MTSTGVFNTLTSGLLTRSRSGVVQILNYRRSKKDQISQESSSQNTWRAWRLFKRQLNNVWFQLGGGGKHLSVRIVREIWRLHVGSTNDYFVKVIKNACKRSSDLEQLLYSRQKTGESRDAVLSKMADNFYTFFDAIMSEEVLKSPKQIRLLAYDLGRRHAAYSSDQYNLTHWDTINLAMMEELEDTGLFDEIDLRAWQRLIAQINDYMFMGYLQTRELITMSGVEQERNAINEDENMNERHSWSHE